MYVFIITLAINFNLAKVITSDRNKLLLISFDGLASIQFKKFLSDYPDSNFKKFIDDGSYSEMIPSFPSLTFPNHISLVTGLINFIAC
jgi:predicted AlkP superfamily pyrophosphatase or phosphodiesterase